MPLIKRSFKLWRDLEKEDIAHCPAADIGHREPLLTMTGGLMIGGKDSVVLQGTLETVREHDLPHRVLSSEDIYREYKGQFTPRADEYAVYEDDAGYLVPEACVGAYTRMAQRSGAEVLYGQEVISVRVNRVKKEGKGKGEENGEGIKGSTYSTDLGREDSAESTDRGDVDGSIDLITVATREGKDFQCRKIILSVGPWLPELLPHIIGGKDLGPQKAQNQSMSSSRLRGITVVRKVLHWLEPDTADTDTDTGTGTGTDVFDKSTCPIYLWDMDGKAFYGFPRQSASEAVKVAFHVTNKISKGTAVQVCLRFRALAISV